MSQIDALSTEEPSQPAAFTVAPEHRRPLNVVGEQLSVLASGAQTGSYEVFHHDGPEGRGAVPHSHPWDESFYVIDGEVTFSINGRQGIAAPGTFVHLPAGTTHWFRAGTGGAEMLSITSREGASHLFADVDREVSAEQPDLTRLLEVCDRHGLTVVAE